MEVREQRFMAYCEDGTINRAGMWYETLFSCSNYYSYRGTIPKRVKNYKDIDNLSTFASGICCKHPHGKEMDRNRASKREKVDNLKIKTGKPPKTVNILLPSIQD
jgi:hypothetical protein